LLYVLKANAIFKSPPLPTLSSTKSVEERKKPEQKPKIVFDFALAFPSPPRS
jgi:hypothetical protein